MRRQCKDNLQLLTRINVRISKVQRALERNFNGHSDFPEILSCFLASGSVSLNNSGLRTDYIVHFSHNMCIHNIVG